MPDTRIADRPLHGRIKRGTYQICASILLFSKQSHEFILNFSLESEFFYLVRRIMCI